MRVIAIGLILKRKKKVISEIKARRIWNLLKPLWKAV
jgi:hypothetical protein